MKRILTAIATTIIICSTSAYLFTKNNSTVILIWKENAEIKYHVLGLDPKYRVLITDK